MILFVFNPHHAETWPGLRLFRRDRCSPKISSSDEIAAESYSTPSSLASVQTPFLSYLSISIMSDPSALKVKIAWFLGVCCFVFYTSTVALAVKKSTRVPPPEPTFSAPLASGSVADAPVDVADVFVEDAPVSMYIPVAHSPRNTPNPCEAEKTPDVQCMVDGAIDILENSGGDISLATGDRDPIDTRFFQNGLCPVNVHWHLGAQFLSEGEYDENGIGVTDIEGSQCYLYDEGNYKFTTSFEWKHCVGMEVGQTYEVRWAHSAAGACGTVNQFQTPFSDGVFCNADIIDPANSHTKFGMQAQVFTIVNDEQFYYPSLIDGMIVDVNMDVGVDVVKFTAASTNSIAASTNSTAACSEPTSLTWQIDRKCHMISASSFDKLCADMKAQKDDLSNDIGVVGSRR